MIQQRGLFEKSPLTIRERFLAFHAANPQVYRELVKLVRAARQRGYERIGMRALWERLRWFVHVDVVDPHPLAGVKLNDHFPPHYARLIASREPDLADMFELRELKTL